MRAFRTVFVHACMHVQNTRRSPCAIIRIGEAVTLTWPSPGSYQRSCATMASKSSRTWSDEETFVLIEIWGETAFKQCLREHR